METETFIRIAIFLGGAMVGCSVGVFMGANINRHRRHP